jgi:hypothetical protein
LYEDLNRDGVINDDDLYTYKSPDPNFFMGMSSGLSVGKWSAGFVARAYFENISITTSLLIWVYAGPSSIAWLGG